MKLAKTYNPDQYEPNIYAIWEKSGAFEPTGVGEPYSIVMPPPNANGDLHVGHALTFDTEDILARYYRMCGRDVAYIPGADHAGFETWVVYDKTLSEKGINRFQYSREQIYSQVWDFVEKQRGNMELQLRALGVSASWNNLVFTLDKKVIDAVYGTFKKLLEDGLVYRGERIVNYSTKFQTCYSDIEIDHKKEKGTQWQIAYPTYDRIGEMVVSTTRPETLFGDAAIAVHPNDTRYKDLIGTRVFLPLTDRIIPIIADESVDPNFGTGAIRVTPAHSQTDYEIGQKHSLERIQVIDFDGTMINVPAQFIGLTVENARKQTIAVLKAEELIRGETTIEHIVDYDYKSGLPIQPLIRDQWFIKVQPLAQRAKKALLNDEITFTPASRKEVLIQYLDNLHDWNISRQIPWGIPIPTFQNINKPDDWIFDERVDESTINVNGVVYKREENTFDTWFSSGQWPSIVTDTLTGGPLSRFYPNDVLETGLDLLDRWVARMIMLGLYNTDKIPFKHVYLHGMVLDEKGKKMSKSIGNVINSIEIISQYGSDALRLGIISNRSAGQDQAFNISRVIDGRNFCNKLWNIARFIENRVGESYKNSPFEPITPADHWIVRQLNSATTDISQKIESYRLSEAKDALYHAIWDNVADWYVEASKQQDNGPMLTWVLDTCLKLAHPFAPFVTETIWQTLSWHNNLLITSNWPKETQYDDIAAAEFSRLKKLVTEIRFVVSELPDNDQYSLLYQNDSLIADNVQLIQKLANLKDVQAVDQARGLRLAASGREAWLDVSAKTLYEHQTNLEARLAETHNQIALLEARLNNEDYIKKAPADLIENSKDQLELQKALSQRLIKELEIIK